MQTRGPGVRVGEFGGAVAGAEVKERYFVRSLGGVRGCINERAGGVGGGDGGVGEDGGEGKAESRDVVVGVEVGGERELVEDVVFGTLDDEEDAKGKRGGGFGGAVGVVGGCETEG